MVVEHNSPTLQSGIKQNDKNYGNFSYFLRGIDVTDQNLDNFDPYLRGVSRIFMHKKPRFMEKQYPGMTDAFKSIVESGYTRIEGISDIDVEFVDFEGGFNGDKFSFVSQAKDNTDSLTIEVYEQSGSPVREYLETWVNRTRDILSGVATYEDTYFPNKASQGDEGYVQYGTINHTCEFIYMTLDPTAKHIEYACMFANCFPTKVPKSHLNYEKGSRDNVSIEIEFRCKKYESIAINQMARYYLNQSKIDYNYLTFQPKMMSQNDILTNNYNSGFRYDGLGGGRNHLNLDEEANQRNGKESWIVNNLDFKD